MGDKQGHPFRGNQWTTDRAEEVTFAEAPGTGDNTPYDIQERLNDQLHDLSVDAQVSLRHYHTEYTAVNTNLREGGIVSDTVKDVDEAFKEAPKLKEPTAVYRGLRSSEFFGSLKPGDVVTDKGFVSTTADPDTARNYASQLAGRLFRTGVPQATIVRIKLPKGTRYLPGAPGHTELVLNRGSRFRVIGSGKDRQGTLAVDLELIK
jgi:hypothetical protein